MTTQDQIKALAELDGWRFVPSHDNSFESALSEYWISDNDEVAFCHKDAPANYLTSYDAIIPVVKKCWESQLFAPEKFYQAIPNYYPHILSFIQYTTPAQLAEALLRATGKWTE
jgi:hypothetical protein